MNKLFSSDGPFMEAVEKTGQLIMLSIIWLICCIPVVTIGTATTALYYSVVKSVRKNVGYPVKEYFAQFKKSFFRGLVITVLAILIIGAAIIGRENINVIYDGILIIATMIMIYIFPVLSRFEMKLTDIVKLAFVMSVRFFYITVLLAGCLAGTVFLLYRILPVWVILILPAGYAYLSSFLVEKAMKKYIKVTDENRDQWYIF